jgi:uncharacterized membrane protein
VDVGTLIAGVLTLAILTFLYRDNPIYRLAESLLIGVSIGYTLVTVWNTTVMDLLLEPLSGGELVLIVPLLLGIMMFARFHGKTLPLSRIPIAVMIGSGAGIAIPVMLEARTIRQIQATTAPLVNAEGFDVATLVVLAGVITTLLYFYFSREHKGALGGTARVGTWFLMVFFGTTFGYTVMSRMSTFIGRMEFLLTDFLHLTN